jgi:hypothetical protein
VPRMSSLSPTWLDLIQGQCDARQLSKAINQKVLSSLEQQEPWCLTHIASALVNLNIVEPRTLVKIFKALGPSLQQLEAGELAALLQAVSQSSSGSLSQDARDVLCSAQVRAQELVESGALTVEQLQSVLRGLASLGVQCSVSVRPCPTCPLCCRD